MKKIKQALAMVFAVILILSISDVTVWAASVPQAKIMSCTNARTGVSVKWEKIKGVTGYRVYRKNSKNAKWKKLADVVETNYTDKTATSGKTYYYCVRAYKGKKKKIFGEKSQYKLQKYLAAPKLMGVEELDGHIRIKFDRVKGAKEYAIYRKTGRSGKYKRLDWTKLNYYNDINTVSNKTYFYTVKAINKKVSSASSAGIEIKVTYYAGDCAQEGHKDYRKYKTVEPTSVLYGYTLYKCKCGAKGYWANLKAPLGETVPSGDEYAYAEAVKRSKAGTQYLDKILKNDKVDLLQVYSGSEGDIRALKKIADNLVVNCRTDYEKVKAVYDWVNENVEYNTQASAYPSDVMRSLQGDCEGQANIFNDMIRLLNIPSATMVGFMGDMQGTLTENNMGKMCKVKHLWNQVYIDGKWAFVDVTCELFAYPMKEEEVARQYYTISADYATPYYKNMNMKMNAGMPVYINGHYYAFDSIGKQSLQDTMIMLSLSGPDTVYHLNYDTSAVKQQYFYRNAEKLRMGEVFTNCALWKLGNYTEKDEELVDIVYYNGKTVRETMYTLNGKQYLDLGVTYKYSGKYLASSTGKPVLQVGDVLEIHREKTRFESKYIWKSSNPSVLSVDSKGRVKALKEGWADISVTDTQHNFEQVFVIKVDNSYKLTDADVASKDSIRTARAKIKAYSK